MSEWMCIKSRSQPQALGAPAAASPDIKGDHLATLRLHGAPAPPFGRFLRPDARHCSRFHRKAAHHDVPVTGDGLDMEMIRQGLNALTQQTQEPLEFHPHRTPKAASRHPCHQQAVDEPTYILCNAVLRAALDELTSTITAVMAWLAAVDMTIFLVLGGLAPRTHVCDDPRSLSTSTGLVSVFGQQVHEHQLASLT
jgi:hypothetical protein